MFDFQKLDVYQKAKHFCIAANSLIVTRKFDRTTNDQLRRASFSIMLNIAESLSRFSNRDRKNFLVIARGSAFESASIFDFLYETGSVTEEEYNDNLNNLEEISKMLLGLIRRLE